MSATVHIDELTPETRARVLAQIGEDNDAALTVAEEGSTSDGGYRRLDFSGTYENQVARLRPHPLNDRVYGGSEPDADLLVSIREHGVMNPIVINRQKEILSGTRRWRAAKACGYKTSPL